MFGSSGAETFIFLGLMLVVFYLFLIRPQKKKEKQRREMVEAMKAGDRVVTIGGIHGEIENVKERHVILLVDAERGVTLKMNRGAISRVIHKDTDETEEN